PAQCREIADLYTEADRFRSKVVMQQVGFGQGTYKYFDYPLPAPVAALRGDLYPPLARIANRWRTRLGEPADLPEAHA
ncbi:2OG-Fe(II) oxygenase, partial [Burkholderia sp. SIMBA_024]|uniref:2OG-Fe(II) oxygenase n=1 Tax=Burkholderia sp. SIMBA_024 TaxID=3085768 RepID=UPI0039791F6C